MNKQEQDCTKAAEWGKPSERFKLSHPRPRFLPARNLVLSECRISLLQLKCKFGVTVKIFYQMDLGKRLFSALWGQAVSLNSRASQVPALWIYLFWASKRMHTALPASVLSAMKALTVTFNPMGLKVAVGKPLWRVNGAALSPFIPLPFRLALPLG